MAINNIKRDVVQSSWIRDFVRANNDILVTLKNGQRFIVRNVPDNIYSEWTRASSKGQYWHQRIKNTFPVDKV